MLHKSLISWKIQICYTILKMFITLRYATNDNNHYPTFSFTKHCTYKNGSQSNIHVIHVNFFLLYFQRTSRINAYAVPLGAYVAIATIFLFQLYMTVCPIRNQDFQTAD
jgi:hypothetical protein